MFVNHIWPQMGSSEGKYLHFRSEFWRDPCTSVPSPSTEATVEASLQQQHQELLGSDACTCSKQRRLDYTALRNVHRLCVLGSLPLLSSSITYGKLRWNGGADNRNSLLLQLPGSCTAPAPLLSKLINQMSLRAHEKFISLSSLVILNSPLLPMQRERSSSHYGFIYLWMGKSRRVS